MPLKILVTAKRVEDAESKIKVNPAGTGIVPDGEVIYIAGSYFGGPKMPLWVYNLRAAEGRARVQFKRETFAVQATELEGQERAAAREVVLRTWPVFEKYEERTDRTIPIFRLVRA